MYRKNMLGKTYHFENWFDDPIFLDFVEVIQVGELVVEPGFEMAAHTQICNEISYVVSGKCTFFTNGKPMQASPGDIHIISTGNIHRILADKDEQLRFTYIGFRFKSEAEKSDLGKLKNFYNSSLPFLLNDKNYTRTYMSQMLSEIYAKLSYNKIMINAYVNQLLVHIYRVYGIEGAEIYNQTIEDAKVKHIIGHTTYLVIRYVDNNILNIKSIKGVAENLGYSSSYLSHLFRAKMGLTLQQYINQKKIESSFELLKDDQFSITQIAEALNYETIQSFCKMFRRSIGCTPTEYRNRYLK